MADNLEFKSGDFVVYPTHGVGKIDAIETQEISGFELKVFVISFDGDRMTLRVPVNKAASAGLRALSTQASMKKAIETLKGKAIIKKTMWSRRAQEYEGKINSGNPVSIAEVIRDLYRREDQEQSYSERQLFQAALERLTRELAAIEDIQSEEASERVQDVLVKSA